MPGDQHLDLLPVGFMLMLLFRIGKHQENTTMTRAIEVWPEGKVSKRKQISLMLLYSLQTQNHSPFLAEVMKTNHLNQWFSESLGLKIRYCQHHHSNNPIHKVV